jgi:RNA-directed DNA polymerase
MTAALTAGAASREPIDWYAINWRQAERNVRRLQARIVQATRAGRWGKVKALQHLLTRSFSGKALAVRRVTANRGKRTPGVDGETWTTPAQKARGIATLRRRGYRPRPLRRVYIPKSNGKKRPLGIPTMRDRAMQALSLLALDPIAETTGDPNSYGFRKERSTADAIDQCYNVLGRSRSARWVLEGDIVSCFDRISHEWLLTHVPLDKDLLRRWLQAGYLEQAVFHPTEEGTPQGGIISPVLANLALDGLEPLLHTRFPVRPGKPNPKMNLVRYADDFIITGRSRELLEDGVKPLVEAFLRERGLALSPEKTAITHIDDGFDFLGYTVRRFGQRLVMRPSRKNVQTFLTKVRGFVKANKQAQTGHLIVHLNRLLRGWTNYHRHVSSKKVFSSVDYALFTMLWRWARRRHPTKGKAWVRKTYFPPHGGRQWVLTGTVTKAGGTPSLVRLFVATSVPYRRHLRVRGEANPYDPAWDDYYLRRRSRVVPDELTGRRPLAQLWQEQGGRCLACAQPLTAAEGWHNHHLVPRAAGGGDQLANRALLHPTCHRQVHLHRFGTASPRPTRGE